MGSDLDAWKAEALETQSPVLQVRVPLYVLGGEAVDVSAFFEKYWKTQEDGGTIVRYGLESAVKKDSKKLSKKTGEQILSLQRATQEASTLYVFAVNASAEVNPSERGRHLLNEISAALEWLFDDDVEDENDAKLAAARVEHDDRTDTMDGLASALDDYAHLADPFRDKLDGLGGFEVGLIDEAKTIAATLRERPQTPVTATPEAKSALELRNRLANLLNEKMNTVRAAARFVYRDRPDIVREVTSAYERRKKAATRRAAAKKKTEKTP